MRFLLSLTAVLPVVAAAQVRAPDSPIRTQPTLKLPTSSRVSLMAASSTAIRVGARVHLRWMVKDGWLPPGGFRLMRTSSTPAVQVYPGSGRSGSRKTTTSFPEEVRPSYDASFLPITGDTNLFPADVPRPNSSLPIFSARATRASQLLPQTQVNDRILRDELNSLPTVKAYLEGLPKPEPATAVRTMSTDLGRTRVLNARRSVLFSALARPELADELGFGAVDTGVANGAVVSYALYEVDAQGNVGAAPIATLANFTVGDDPMPPKPTGLIGSQAGEGTIELRWDRVTPQLETKLGAVFYRVRRIVNGSATILTPRPITILDLKGPQGYVEPVAFFVDRQAPPGSVTYTVELIDGFGRDSVAASLALNVVDLRTPETPSPVTARLSGKGQIPPVSVTWKAKGTGLAFNVYRQDIDAKTPLVKLTATPINANVGLETLEKQAIALFESRTGELTPPKQIDMQKVVQQLQRTQSTVWKFVDASADQDRKYRYIVRSMYTTNLGRESQDGTSAILSVPSFAVPPAPANLTIGNFVSSTSKPAGARSFQPLIGSFGSTSQLNQPSLGTQPSLGNQAGLNIGNQLKGLILKPAVEIGGSFKLTWTKPSNFRVPTFRIFRQVEGQPATKIELGTTTDATYTDQVPRSHMTRYVYSVMTQSRWAVKGRTEATIVAVAPSTLAPTIPLFVSVAPDGGGNGIVVKFRPNPPAEQVTTYRVFRKVVAPSSPPRVVVTRTTRPRAPTQTTLTTTGTLGTNALAHLSDTGYEQVGQVAASQGAELSFADMQATDPTRKYYYKLEAENQAALKSERSDPLSSQALKMSVAAPAKPTLTASPDGVTVSWAAVSGATAYVVKRAPAAGGTFVQVSGRVTGTNFQDRTGVRGRPYRYAVVAVDGFGNVSTDSPASDSS